jgi:glycine/D-amino acid oxidase-like deaminating enzyme
MWVHTRRPGIALDLARAGIKIVQDLAPDLGPTIELKSNGGIIFFQTDAQRRVMKEFAESRTALGVPTTLLDEQQARELTPLLPNDAIGATYCAEDGQLRSPEFVRRLAEVCDRKGVRIREGVTVVSLLLDGDRLSGVRTTEGVVLADRVVMATGAWTAPLEREGISLPIHPVRVGVLLTEPVEERMEVVMFGPGGARQYDVVREQPSFREEDFAEPWEDTTGGFQYNELVSQRADGRLQIGNPEDDFAGLDQRVPIRGMKMMIDAFLARWPHLEGIAIEDSWSGLMPITPDATPIVDELDDVPGLFVATGHNFGNVAGPSSAKLAAELVNGDTPSLPVEELAIDRPALRVESADSGSLVGVNEKIRW